MAYQQNIPQAGDRLKDSQADLLGNFQAIKQLIDVNHATFGSANEGKHNKVTFPVQNPASVFAAGDLGLYSFLSPLTARNELYLYDYAGNRIPITASQQVASSAGWTYLPSGVLIKWGNSTANGLTTITFPSGATIPAFTSIFSMSVTTAYISASDGDKFVRLNNFVAPWTQFSVYGSARTTVSNKSVAFQYIAIGK